MREQFLQYALVEDGLNIIEVFCVTAAHKMLSYLFCLINWPYKLATDPCIDLQVTSPVIETS